MRIIRRFTFESVLAVATVLAAPGADAQSAPARLPSDTAPKNQVEETIAAAPSWYTDGGLSDDDFILGAGTALSRDLQLAVDKALLAGRNQIANRLELRFSSLAKRFQEEVGSSDNPQLLDQMTSAYKSVVTATMAGTKARQQEVRNERGMYRVYVLVELPIGPAGTGFITKIKENEKLFTQLRATRAFAQLEKEGLAEDARKQPSVNPPAL